MNYGNFGGQYVPQELKEKLNEIEEEFEKAKNDDKFKKEYLYYLNQYGGFSVCSITSSFFYWGYTSVNVCCGRNFSARNGLQLPQGRQCSVKFVTPL